MKGKILMFLFALPFAAVGVWMGYSIGGSVTDAWEMRSWSPVQAELSNSGYRTSHGDDSTTYEAYATYHYVIDGQRYSSDRVGLSSGADNIGDYQTDMGSLLSQRQARGETITVYVNPSDPTDAIIDRDLRWGLVGFKAIFLLVFGGVGFGLIIATFMAPKEKDKTEPQFVDKPWLLKDAWQGGAIRSGSKSSMWFAWGFAAFWNLVSAPLPFVIYDEVLEKQNYLGLVGLLFPLVGIGMVFWAIKATHEWRRFGPGPVTLDPFPASIGGHAGGTIDINLPYESATQFQVTLTCIHSYISGSGKNRSRRESASWQDTQVAHAAAGVQGTRLQFRFDVPQELQESDAAQDNDSYYLWRLNVSAELPGADFDRDYEIPAYKTGESSKSLSDFAVQEAHDKQSQIDAREVRKHVQINFGAEGTTFFYPMFRNFGSSFMGMLFGAIFGGAGLFLIIKESHWFMGSIFTFVGGLIFLFGIYSAFNSLEVSKSGSVIRSVRRFAGIVVGREEMAVAEFTRFKKKSTMKTQSGKKHTVHYQLSAVAGDGRKMVIGDGFRGANQVRAAMKLFEREFGLRQRAKVEKPQKDFGDYDFLASDA